MSSSIRIVILVCALVIFGSTLTPAEEPDYDSIADNVVNHSLRVQPGEIVMINGVPDQIPLMEALFVAVSKAGGQPIVQMNLPNANKRAIMETPMEHLKRLPTAGLQLVKLADCTINVGSVQDPNLFADVPEDRLAASRQAAAPLNDAFRVSRNRNVSLGQTGGIPTKAYAESVGANHQEVVSMFWRAVAVDPGQLAATGTKVAGMLKPGSTVRVTSAAGTDLTFKIGKQSARINAGRTEDVVQASGPASVWLPAGEAYATVDTSSATGTLVVPYTTLRGAAVKNLKLSFQDGRVTELKADTNQEMFQRFLDSSDAKSKHLSVVDIGTNSQSQPLKGSHYYSWEMGGMVTLGIGNNAWAGGDNTADAASSFHLTDVTLSVGNETIVKNGGLQEGM